VPLISYQKGKQIGKLVTHRQHRGAWEGGENDFSSLSPHLIDNFHFGSSHRFVVTVVLMCLHTDKPQGKSALACKNYFWEYWFIFNRYLLKTRCTAEEPF